MLRLGIGTINQNGSMNENIAKLRKDTNSNADFLWSEEVTSRSMIDLAIVQCVNASIGHKREVIVSSMVIKRRQGLASLGNI